MTVGRSAYADATLGDLMGDLRAGAAWIAGGIVFGCLAAFLFLAMAVPHYRAQMIVAPVAQHDGDKAESAGRAAPVDFARFESILRGPTVARAVMQDKAIMDGIAADARWRGIKAPAIDSPAKMAAYLEKRVAIESVAGTGLRRVVYTHPDPLFAARLPESLVRAADMMIREDGRRATDARVEELGRTLARTQNAVHRRTLTEMMMGQEEARMVLAIDQPFAASVAEPAAAGPKPYWPRKIIVVPVMVFMGAFFGFALFSLRRQPA